MPDSLKKAYYLDTERQLVQLLLYLIIQISPVGNYRYFNFQILDLVLKSMLMTNKDSSSYIPARWKMRNYNNSPRQSLWRPGNIPPAEEQDMDIWKLNYGQL